MATANLSIIALITNIGFTAFEIAQILKLWLSYYELLYDKLYYSHCEMSG